MGGSAFKHLSASAFPRIPARVYNELKVQLLPRLQSLYTHVTVPREAPEKFDYGDLDFIVAIPKDERYAPFIPHDQIKEALGAEEVIPMPGNRTSNYAVAVPMKQWHTLGYGDLEDEARRMACQEEGEGRIYYQVDVNVCESFEEWERIVFFHGYGDLGMILGLVAKNAGLLLGEKGLKIADQPYAPFELSTNFADIIDFFGLSMATWSEGFPTRIDVFRWVSTSLLFNPRKFRSDIGSKRMDSRTMYQDFKIWVSNLPLPPSPSVSQLKPEEVRLLALNHFHKLSIYEDLQRERQSRLLLKESFNGTKVSEWTGLGTHWSGVSKVMKAVRETCGGDGGIIKILEKQGEDGLKRELRLAMQSLGLLTQEEWDRK